MREGDNEKRADDPVFPRQRDEPVFPEPHVREYNRLHDGKREAVPAARSTQTIYGYRRCRVSGRGGENPSRDGELQGKLLKTRDAGKRLKADGERVGKTEWKNQCRNDRFASNQQGQHSRWMMKGVTDTCFRHPHLRPITVQTRRICNVNTAILQCKHGDFAMQTRRICSSNTANLLVKHGEFARQTRRDCISARIKAQSGISSVRLIRHAK